MRFLETEIPGLWVVEIEPHQDDRGFFGRTWCEQEAAARGIAGRMVQSSLSYNSRRGTLRGMHYQASPSEEVKLVRCINGAIWDVAVDVREDSATFGRHVAVELSARNRRSLYIPKGCAHGFLTLCDHAEVYYQISAYHAPECARGFRWNDPWFRIDWPRSIDVISERDRSFPDFAVAAGR